MSELPKYQEQFERMKRSYERFKEINQGKEHNQHSEYCHDDMYSFFLNCYHLKDWIKNDESIELPKGTVEDFINKHDCMRLCADICNGIKHLNRENDRSGKDPKFGGRHITFNVSESIIKIKFSILTKDGTIDAFELATECIQKWEKFILTFP
jgi:hypothetical protein